MVLTDRLENAIATILNKDQREAVIIYSNNPWKEIVKKDKRGFLKQASFKE